MTNLLLLGAGASYGSFASPAEAPPLGNGFDGLFARLQLRSAEAASLPSDLKLTFVKNFEEGMSEYFARRQGNVARLQLDIGAYLAAFSPAPGNAYFELLAATDPSTTIYASLNYDTLLEESALQSGRNIAYSLEPLPNTVRVVKPHGSSNFWPDIAPGSIRGCTFINCSTDIEAPVVALHPDVSRARYPLEDSFSPCMSLYAPNKPVRTSPSFVQAQQRLWAAAVQQAKRIIVMGVRVYPSDTHIWGPLLQAQTALHYFGLAGDRDEFEAWAGTRRQASTFHQFGFREAVGVVPSLRT